MHGLRRRSIRGKRWFSSASPRFRALAAPGGLSGRPGDPTLWSRIAWLLALLAVPLLLLLLLAPWRQDDPPDVAAWALDGPREPQCLRLVLANDVSGSMNDYAVAREQALTALLDWLPKNLKSDDELAVVEFAETAVTKLPPATVGTLVPGQGQAGGVVADGMYTWAAPVLAQVDSWPASSCDVALVLLSDAQLVLSAENGIPTELPSDPDGGRRLALAHRIHNIRLLVPDPDITVPSAWQAGFPAAAPQRFDGLDADQTAKSIALAIAGLTGQKLIRRR
jgi:hypothetical protein